MFTTVIYILGTNDKKKQQSNCLKADSFIFEQKR